LINRFRTSAHQRCLGDSQFVEAVHEPADVLVDVVDHAEEVLLGWLQPATTLVSRPVFGPGDRGGVRSVGGDGGEKRLLSRRLGLDPLERLPEEEVRAIALGLLERALVEQGRIEVAVVRGVAAGTGVGLGDRRCRKRQSLPLVDRVGDTVCKLMPSGHQGGSGGRAGGAYEKVGEP
jgi:hypothetical protein